MTERSATNEKQTAAMALGSSLKGKSGRRYWKSLEQLAETPEFQRWVDDEFPERRSLLELDRRGFLKFMGASLMLAGLGSAGCRYLPEDRLVPFVQGPEDRLPGVPVHYASIATLAGFSTGVKVKTVDGRPIKLDGNPNHPSSLGGLDARTQARVLDMYDPDRLQVVKRKGEPMNWQNFLAVSRAKLDDLAANGGKGVAVLSQTVGSPSLQALMSGFMQKYPQARWVQYDAVNGRNKREGAVLAFGAPVDTLYKFREARVLVSVDSDVMMEGPGAVCYQADIMSQRDLGNGATQMSRIYAVESAPTTIGVVADHRVPLRASEMMGFVRALASRLGVPGSASSTVPSGLDDTLLEAIANDLRASPGASAVFGGDHLPASVHALIHAVNGHLGNFGKTVVHIGPVVPSTTSQMADLASLASEMASGQIAALFILGGNPVYDAPADLDFAGALAQVPFKAHHSTHDDETGALCDWQAPAAHFLEAWGDGRGHDGTASVQQPAILPLYDCKSEHELVDALIGESREGMEIVQSYWKSVWGADGFDARWQATLANGVVEGSASPPVEVVVKEGLVGALPQGERADGIEIVLKPDPTVFDGRFANNGWLQELPKPISNLTWDNAAYMSHATAVRLGVVVDPKYLFIISADGAADMVAITVDGRTVEAAVYVQHGMADGVVVAHLGYGRTRGGKVLLELEEGKPYEGGGFDAYKLLRSVGANPYMVVNGAKVVHTDRHYPLANSQFHNTIDMTKIDSDREILEEMTLVAFATMEQPEEEERMSLYEDDMIGSSPVLGNVFPQSSTDESGWNSEDNYQWAMTIDLSLCTGCNACVIACQSENNIPTVGKYQVQRGREMHWIRIDRYYQGQGDESEWPVANPPIRLQPVACMQCENAPCEPVCPVAATVHSKEGLNQMVYNRCVGTRYCSNNCPYKVRRFNFLNYANHNDVPVKMLQNNPDVTVRGRGVMEKCTYCVQRINRARIDAKKRDTRILDGDVKTACQEACPSHAIVFGDKTDYNSSVSKMLRDKRRYRLLDKELNTRPRTTYMARVTNPSKEVGA